MSPQVETLYGVKRLVLASASAMPMSRTSGARLVAPSCWTAFTSSWLLPSGLSDVIGMPYVAVNLSRMAP